MAVSPNFGSDGVVRVTLHSGGAPVADTVQVCSVQVRRAIGTIPTALIVVEDGQMPTGDWPIADGAMFEPGAAITVCAGYGDDEAVIFAGIVVRVGARIDADGLGRLQVHCQDAAVTMTRGRHNATFSNSTDSEVIAAVIARSALPYSVAKTSVVHSALVQYYCSDWDFMVARAEANGLQVIVTDGSIAVAPAAAGAAELTVGWGFDLLDFSADLDARDQFEQMTSIAWDPSAQAVATASAAPTQVGAVGNISAGALAAALRPVSETQQTAAQLTPGALDAWAAARQVKAALARLRGRMTFQGSAKARVGGTIEVKGVGKRFSGDVFVSGLTHDIVDGAWTTGVEFGLAPTWFTQRADVAAPPAAGWVPGAAGLQVGIVVGIADDPAGEQRVAVSLPLLDQNGGPIWARAIQPYASKGVGTFFMPEVGDEVVIGYFNDDPSHPVILGCVYSSNRVPPYAPTQSNDTKAIVTRSKTRIEFDDSDVSITVATPANNKIVISDMLKTIIISDETGNTFVTSPSGIALNSPKDISLTAKGAINLAAVQGITVSADGDVAVSGLNILADAGVAFTGRGAAKAELSADGEVVVRGAMVMIN